MTRSLFRRFWNTSSGAICLLAKSREFSRILKLDGQVFFFVPNDCLGPIDEIEHIIECYVNTFEGFLRRHFDVASIEVIKVANFSMSIPMGQVVRRRGKRLAL